MLKILLSLVLTILTNVVTAQQVMVPVTTDWKIDPKTRVGATTRITATQQNPFPFCFSTAAAMLYDQHRCMQENKLCSTIQQTSFLAVTASGQRLDSTGEIDVLLGGAPVLSLLELIKLKNPPSFANCNYNQIDPKNTNIQYKLSSLNGIRELWLKYKDYTPYLERYYRREYKNVLREIRPSITDEETNVILNLYLSSGEIAAQLLLNKQCFSDTVKDPKYTIKYVSPNDPKAALAAIDKILSTKRPVLISFCYTDNCKTDMHSLILISRAKFINEITNDTRTAYWLVNSWGEEWQKQNHDGWVFAEHLLTKITGALLWLETK